MGDALRTHVLRMGIEHWLWKTSFEVTTLTLTFNHYPIKKVVILCVVFSRQSLINTLAIDCLGSSKFDPHKRTEESFDSLLRMKRRELFQGDVAIIQSAGSAGRQ